ncbi:MAG: hypothetical protein IKP35_02395 [Alphaproteobacteria bacterium]|nr:hypothetical protein [Alphaproteobacteria bacterium]
MLKHVFDFGDNKNLARNKLFEVVSKGVDLLASDYINEELLNSWKKYAKTVLELVDEAYGTHYSSDFYISDTMLGSSYFSAYSLHLHDVYNHITPGLNPIHIPYGQSPQDFKGKLQRSLNELLNILSKLQK